MEYNMNERFWDIVCAFTDLYKAALALNATLLLVLSFSFFLGSPDRKTITITVLAAGTLLILSVFIGVLLYACTQR